MLRRNFIAGAAALALAATAAACGGDSGSEATAGGTGGRLSLVAYSTPQEAYSKLIPAFQDTPAGEGVEFEESYGASGDQSRAVEAGQKADVVEFALETDMTRLVDADIVAPDWNANEHEGMVTNSVVVIVVRKGNPKGIDGWDDLVRDDVEVITPNPFTSGGARWNIMAAYGYASGGGTDKAAGVDYLEKLFANVPVQDDSARDALQTFAGGKGDALLSYENEAILAQDKGAAVDYVVPDQTILIENPLAYTTTTKHEKAAKAFVDFLLTDEAQTIFAETGYRPVVDGIESPHEFPEPADLYTIEDFGGWDSVKDEFFDSENADAIMTKIETDLGVSTEK